MIKTEYSVIGVMSGTSLDGIDLAFVKLWKDKTWHFNIVCRRTFPYDDRWHKILRNLIYSSLEDIISIDTLYTEFLANVIGTFIKTQKIGRIDAICSHGHTALHNPKQNITYQIGNLPKISSILQNTVVCNFRIQDVRYGGQGAPLVPIGDKLLFSKYNYCLNLGGFANISMDDNTGKRIAFDVCPVNIVFNYYALQLGLNFDENGEIAASGNINLGLLNALNTLKFYSVSYPKSLGLEWVEAEIYPLIDAYKIEIPDILRTFCEHVAMQIANVIEIGSGKTLFITGGGTYNGFLIKRLKSLTNIKIIIPDKDIIEYKEAIIFALLGVLKLRNEVNCLMSVTGASRNHSSGTVYKFLD